MSTVKLLKEKKIELKKEMNFLCEKKPINKEAFEKLSKIEKEIEDLQEQEFYESKYKNLNKRVNDALFEYEKFNNKYTDKMSKKDKDAFFFLPSVDNTRILGMTKEFLEEQNTLYNNYCQAQQEFSEFCFMCREKNIFD
jgi:hypothetical protein